MTKAIPTSSSANNIEKYRFVFCSGMPRSGSTCVYNIARLLLNECCKDTTIYSDYVGEGKPVDETIKAYFNKGVIFLIKFHRALQSTLAFPMVETGLAKNIYSFRNPMNAASSVHDFFKIPFKKAVNSIELSLEDKAEWVKRPNSLFIDFNEINSDLLSVTREIAKHLGLAPSESTLEKIAEEVSYENMKKKAESLKDHNEQLHEQFNHDKETLLHVEHAPQNQKRDWRKALSQEQIEFAQERFKPWLEESNQSYGYLQEDINQFADADNIVCWTFCNEGHIDMAHNWWSHFSSSNPERKPVIITISQKAKDYFAGQNIPCILFRPPFQVSNQEVDFRKDNNWTKIVACKLDICREILSKGHFSFFNDSDVVVMKPIDHEVLTVINSEFDIKFQKNHFGNICSGVYLAKPCEAIIKLFDRLAEGLENYDINLNHYGEQDFLKSRLEQMHGIIKWGFLPQTTMPNGAIWYKEKKSLKNKVILVHYNCIVGKTNKVREMKKDSAWNNYLDKRSSTNINKLATFDNKNFLCSQKLLYKPSYNSRLDDYSIDIVMPCYNAKDTIIDVLNGIERQTYKNYTVYIIDNCSTDGTVDFIKSHSLYKNKKINLRINPENIGYVRNVRKALSSGNSPYTALCSSNDTIYDNYLLELIKKHKQDPHLGIAYALPDYFDEDDKFIRRSTSSEYIDTTRLNAIDSFLEVINKPVYSAPFWSIYNKKVLEIMSPFPFYRAGDHVFISEAALYGDICLVQKNLFKRRFPCSRKVKDFALMETDLWCEKNDITKIFGWHFFPFISKIYAYHNMIQKSLMDDASKIFLISQASVTLLTRHKNHIYDELIFFEKLNNRTFSYLEKKTYNDIFGFINFLRENFLCKQ